VVAGRLRLLLLRARDYARRGRLRKASLGPGPCEDDCSIFVGSDDGGPRAHLLDAYNCGGQWLFRERCGSIGGPRFDAAQFSQNRPSEPHGWRIRRSKKHREPGTSGPVPSHRRQALVELQGHGRRCRAARPKSR
jgi:hypothetical protein